MMQLKTYLSMCNQTKSEGRYLFADSLGSYSIREQISFIVMEISSLSILPLVVAKKGLLKRNRRKTAFASRKSVKVKWQRNRSTHPLITANVPAEFPQVKISSEKNFHAAVH